MFRVETFAGVSDGTGAFNGLSASRIPAEGVIGFMVVIPTEWFSVIDIEFLVREGLLTLMATEAFMFHVSQTLPHEDNLVPELKVSSFCA